MFYQIFPQVLFTVMIMSCVSASTDAPSFSDTERSNRAGVTVDNNETNIANTNALSVSSIEGNEWKLIEVNIDGNDTRFSRNTLPTEPGNFFTLNFDAQNISGVGVPNRYSAPYTISDNKISIMLIRSTMMASFFQPENLTEQNFFIYMQNAHEWKLANDKLELLSKTSNGREVRLVFSL